MKRLRKSSLGNENEHDYTRRYGKFSLKQIDCEVEKESFFNRWSFQSASSKASCRLWSFSVYGHFPTWKADYLEGRILEKCQQAPFGYACTRFVDGATRKATRTDWTWETSLRHEKKSSIDRPQSSFLFQFLFQHLRFAVPCKQHKSLFREYFFYSLFSCWNLNQIFMGLWAANRRKLQNCPFFWSKYLGFARELANSIIESRNPNQMETEKQS